MLYCKPSLQNIELYSIHFPYLIEDTLEFSTVNLPYITENSLFVNPPYLTENSLL